jgi:plasmid stabilization system protein ParE
LKRRGRTRDILAVANSIAECGLRILRRKRFSFQSAFRNPKLNRGGLKAMARGDKSSYTDKQKRQAEHIEEGYEKRGVSDSEAEKRAWATVNKSSGGGKKSGSGRGKKTDTAPFKKGGKKASKKSGGSKKGSSKKSSSKKGSAKKGSSKKGGSRR